MTSPSRTPRPSAPPSQRRTRSLVVDTETTAQTQIAGHVLTAIPPSTQLDTNGPTNTVPTNRTTNPRSHVESTPRNLETRTNGEGTDATSTNEPLTTAIPIGSAIAPAASHPESESDLTGQAQAQSQDNNELNILVLTICSSIPLRGSIFSQRIHLQFAQQKYLQVLESLYNSPALAAYNDLKDNNSLNGHRLSILTEAIQSEDYYFLALVCKDDFPSRQDLIKNRIRPYAKLRILPRRHDRSTSLPFCIWAISLQPRDWHLS